MLSPELAAGAGLEDRWQLPGLPRALTLLALAVQTGPPAQNARPLELGVTAEPGKGESSFNVGGGGGRGLPP